ncbi:SEFIR domain-containing protein [Umezawaea sp. Da 62-37]|uniref:SEFIR domain-containing protein n=1 Tax=Umezawaea sp. Da 62-37 TaxID=3075927 RepID=UPI0028F707DA|nr:SEFIR domain-containing protein [Umezawaea sp. Da 62-37]WNV83918.1 SEFIR domain-containing protein [Umezawaea sp. Da 62-37]
MDTEERQQLADATQEKAPRIFITYSHDDERHVALVREFGEFLVRHEGLDVVFDQWADDGRRDWALWASQNIAEADFILVVASLSVRLV